jgi:NAD(P)-dependent dehydrogenase (short-subunit alcohol dehydrogenase family)
MAIGSTKQGPTAGIEIDFDRHQSPSTAINRNRKRRKREGRTKVELKGRVAVVTGGASGIGRGMTEAFLDEGMKVVIGDIERDALDKTLTELAASGGEVVGAICDVSSQDSLDALAKTALDAFGSVHVLCNNAGVAGEAGPVWERSLEDWNWVMGVNLLGVLHGIRSFVPIMIEQGDEGHVVNTASMAGLIAGGGTYGVSKHACVALSEGLFSDFAQHAPKLGASVLCPGWVKTRIIESERNRPEAPRESPGADAPLDELMRKMVEGAISSGLDPREVGGIVARAIKARQFYILTHPWENMVERRTQNIVEKRDPIGLAPPGMTIPGTQPDPE